MSRMAPPDPAFLPQIQVDTESTRSGHALVTFSHPRAHIRNSDAQVAMLAIAFRLGLRHGAAFPRTGQYIYNISGLWALDYGHPRDCLCFSPTDFFWPLIAWGRGGTLVAVSLEPDPHAEAGERILTGRLALGEWDPENGGGSGDQRHQPAGGRSGRGGRPVSLAGART